VSNEEAAAKAKAGGLTVIMDTCIGAAHKSLGIPPRS
jgi:predicted CoA-binding protein